MTQDMEALILARLRTIEHEYGVKIIYAAETGSRAWGLENQDSDYDVRFIYKHSTDWYLNIFPQKDVIELSGSDLLDLSGWDIKKTLLLLYRSNPGLLEWLNSPVVYLKDEKSFNEISSAAVRYLSQKAFVYHHLNMAKSSYRDCQHSNAQQYKKYLYVLKSLFSCKWIELYHTTPPVNFRTLVKNVSLEPDILRAVFILLEEKRAVSLLDFYITQSLDYFTGKSADFLPGEKHPKAELEDLFRVLLNIGV